MKKIINISGEPREYKRDKLIYVFPYPTTKPTEVLDDIAKILVKTKQFVEITDNELNKDGDIIESKMKELFPFKVKGDKINGTI